MSTGLIWIIMIVVMILSQIIQSMLQSRFEKYSRVPTNNRMTGAEIATKMLADNGITDVKVTCIPGRLTDHYNPQTKTVNLSEAVYNSSSVAAAAVAAHECGHVLQHAKGYLPLQLRTALVPVVSFSSRIVQWVLFGWSHSRFDVPQLSGPDRRSGSLRFDHTFQFRHPSCRDQRQPQGRQLA